MNERLRQHSSEDKLTDLAQLLYGQALLAEGGQLDDPGQFATVLSKVQEAAATAN